MRARFLLSLLIPLLLLPPPIALGQTEPTGDEVMEEVKTLNAVRAALEAGDLAAAAEGLGLPNIAEERAAEWQTAIEERLAARRGLTSLPGLKSEIPDEDALKSREKLTARGLRDLTTNLTIYGEDYIPPEVNPEELGALEARLADYSTRRKTIEQRLTARNEDIERVRGEVPAVQAKLVELKAALNESQPDPADLMGTFRRKTAELEQSYREQWIQYANQLTERGDAILNVLDKELDLLTRQEAREKGIVERAGKAIQENHLLLAAGFRKEAEDFQKQADALDPEKIDTSTPEGKEKRARLLEKKAGLLRNVAIFTLREKVETDLQFRQQLKAVIRDETVENEDFLEGKTWVEKRFEASRGVSTRTSTLLIKGLNRVRSVRRRLNRELIPQVDAWYEKYLTAQADVDDRLRELKRATGEELLKRELKNREKRVDEILPLIRELDKLYAEREAWADEIYPVILSLIYWVHSDPPLGTWVLEALPEELEPAGQLLFGSRTIERAHRAAVAGDSSFVLAAVGMFLLFCLGIILPGILRRRSLEWSYPGRPMFVLLQRLFATVLIASLAPLCLLLAARLLSSMELPTAWETPARMLLQGLAMIFFLRRLFWSMSREGGVLETNLKLSADAARQLQRTLRWTIRGMLFLLLPWWILKSYPIGLVVLPRLLFTVTLAYFAVMLLRLVRGKAPLSIALFGPTGFWPRAWFVIGPILALGLTAIVVMEVLGFRYGAARLALNVLQTFGAALLIALFYKVLLNVTEKAARRLRYRRDDNTNYADARKLSEEVFQHATRFVGGVAVLVAVVFLARFWGIGESVQSFFEGVRLHTIDEDTTLTLWDVLRAIAVVLAGHILVANLPALFEVLVFSRMDKTDKGTRFAIVTISRYLILFAAYSAAVLILHISLPSLGYIFAALSVGLGFGLQEIVSNFVSGLILFFERPVRVGDFVSVGDTNGTVEKISIRATEVLNLDRQVIIIPNRMFITQEVTNWSHNDEFIRRTIEVGVAYGTDVEQVKRILSDVATANARVRKTPPVEILMMAFGDSSLNFLVRVYSTIEDRNTVMHEINSEITRRFEKEGIEIPFPQRDLHVRSIQDRTAIEALLHHQGGSRKPE